VLTIARFRAIGDWKSNESCSIAGCRRSQKDISIGPGQGNRDTNDENSCTVRGGNHFLNVCLQLWPGDSLIGIVRADIEHYPRWHRSEDNFRCQRL
jgi:hypothetical protein